MMKLYRFSTILLVAMLGFITGCSSKDFSIEGKIAPPVNEDITIEGTWKIEGFNTIRENRLKEDKRILDYIGKTAMFDQVVCVFGGDECLKPEYKMIHVSAVDYMQNKYKIDPEQIGIHAKRIDVITITSNNQIFYEFIKKNDHTLYVYASGGFLSLEKQSDTVQVESKNSGLHNVSINEGTIQDTNALLKSGVLLGIRSQECIDENKG